MPKKWYTSRTIWACLATGGIGIYNGLIAAGVQLPPIPEWVLSVLGVIGIYGRLKADTAIDPSVI